ncbi:hypothetical protein OGAPHI_003067 [Ogataea philodendri]|uniref:Peptidase M48 domain-containing protein n=1 Tax=Ogataea philodendri TaxID=1378263 RepID=A0A9P8P7Y2_9ASCO|nr:uncharacterized protein OGAPHI_003067 [Ogataea philodendri]KAH3667418.1 hypothetical protein OGAPHI_003067 [Ogataea philodendri]
MFKRLGRLGRFYSTYHHFGNKTSRTGWTIELTPKGRRNLAIGGAGLAVVVATHLEQAPVTHRTRLMLAPAWMESWTAESSYKGLIQQYHNAILPQNHPTTIRVKNIMTRLIAAAQNFVDPETGERTNLFEDLRSHTLPAIDWKIHVIDDVNRVSGRPTPNAFVIGDGKVFVFRSILQLTQNDDALATVLAHELGHLLAHHIRERLSAAPLYTAVAVVLNTVFGTSNINPILSNILLESPNSRAMETEADYIGLMVMSLACFNPHESPNFWNRMVQYERKSGQYVPELMSTHPKSERRMQNIRDWTPKAEKLYEIAGCGELSELLVKLHKPYLEKLLSEQQDDEMDTDVLSTQAMLELFLLNLKQISNHSSLLVDHFMSKNLLLMDTKPDLKASSAKYICIDNCLNKLIDKRRQLTIIITAANSRELDLIETILIGKKNLQYYRFSGSSVYYDNHGSFDFTKQELHRASVSVPQTGKKHPTEDYVPRVSKNSAEFQKLEQQKDRVLSIYLILSNQLHSLVNFEELQSDLVISLDSELEQNLSIPIIKPIHLNGVEYFDLALGPQLTGFERQKHLAKLFLTQRAAPAKTVSVDEMVSWLDGMGTYPHVDSAPAHEVSDEDALKALDSLDLESSYQLERYEFYREQYKPQEEVKKPKIEEAKYTGLTYHEYQLKLGRLIYDRFEEITGVVDRLAYLLQNIHEDDSLRQKDLEDRVVEIGDKFNRLQTAKTTAASLAKQADKNKDDDVRLDETSRQIHDRLEDYRTHSKLGALGDDIDKRRAKVAELKEKLAARETSYRQLADTNELLRTQYQQKSSGAAEMSAQLMEVKKTVESLETESKGQFRVLQQAVIDGQIRFYEQRTQALQVQNTFLEKYVKSLDNIAKEKATVGRVRASRIHTFDRSQLPVLINRHLDLLAPNAVAHGLCLASQLGLEPDLVQVLAKPYSHLGDLVVTGKLHPVRVFHGFPEPKDIGVARIRDKLDTLDVSVAVDFNEPNVARNASVDRRSKFLAANKP